MRYISEKQYEAELKKIQHINASNARHEALKAAKESGKIRRKKKHISASKVALFIMFVFMLAISVWYMYEAHRLQDLSQSYALIGIAASTCAALISYFVKSKAENTEGGITYEMAMMDANSEDCEG